MVGQTLDTESKKHIACLGCRIRRRKCDGLKPICSACVDLNIPVRLCVYHDARIGYKADKAEKTLEKIKEQNLKLKKELQKLKRSSSGNLVSTSFPTRQARKRHQNDPYLLHLPNKAHKKNPLTATTVESSGSFVHYGPISWYAIASTNETLKNISGWFVNVIKMEKERYDRTRSSQRHYGEGNPKLKALTQSLVETSLDIRQHDTHLILQQLLVEISMDLPPKDTLDKLLAYYFHVNSQRTVGFVYVDEGQFYEHYKIYLQFDSKGTTSLFYNGDQDCLLFVMLLLAALAYTGFFASRSIIDNVPDVQINHILMIEYLEALIAASGSHRVPGSSSFMPYLCPEYLIVLIHLGVFERCTPLGRRLQGPMGIGDSLASKQAISCAKVLNLDKDIDLYYPDKSENYKRGLKSIWTCLVYYDLSEALDTGIDLKIKPEDLVMYEYDTSPYVRSLVVLNKVLNQFNEKAVEISGLELTDYIEKQLVSQLDKFLSNDLPSGASDLQYLRSFDFDDIAGSSKYVSTLQMAAIKMLFYSLSQSLYQFCTKMAEQNNGNWRRYELLAIKKGSTLMQYLKDTIEAVRRLILHDNAKYFSLIPTLQIVGKQVTFSLRRCTLFGGHLALRNSNQRYNYQVLNELVNDPQKYAKSLMKSTVPSKRYEIFSYNMQDLEDLEIEKDLNLMKQKLSHLFESKFLIFKLSRMIQMVAKALDNDKFNLNFVKLNYVFFYCSSASNLFLSLAYPPEDNTKLMLIPINSDPQHIDGSAEDVPAPEFNFNDLFKSCIDTTSDNFDFKSFFTGSTDLYQKNEFDEFFQSLDAPGTDSLNDKLPDF
ncbi:hypothetical protein WICANDRAFT_107577 [Wickerhamomyces anomalus NRRL Y-366-8]|uniref:Zn(2)-C6 fungal-type domain-containing protein n=1 Tax=Wickerhamomyces anomalus (strain ATCC 58044 / CBS 1984 / NCYC 433 / NRRL Y-366-8) TaxID=683960 RepID=A0A1E3NXI5_WICAA|nr:uncharacterized protein WICANDRAFT_107577 [Wickerhamomyces anomalus NRRL Y-366-8]ODQ57257.1 hypothetical protein WICANDRAFT_107577 [Wickerhamomyces anomalus NRRL Y-366-8]